MSQNIENTQNGQVLETVSVLETDVETLRSIIYSNYLNKTKESIDNMEKMKAYVIELGFPFNDYIAHIMSTELPLQPAKDLIYNEFTNFEDNMNVEFNIAYSNIKLMGKNFKDQSETLRNELVFVIKTANLKHIAIRNEFEKGLVQMNEFKKIYLKCSENMESSILKKLEQRELKELSLDNLELNNPGLSSQLFVNLEKCMKSEISTLENDMKLKTNEIKKFQEIQKQTVNIIQDNLEKKFIHLLEGKHSNIENEELYEKLEKKLVNDVKSLRDKINSNHSKLSDKVNKGFNDKEKHKEHEKNEFKLQIKECNDKISALTSTISKSELSLKTYIDSKMNDKKSFIKQSINTEVSKIKNEYNKKILNIQGDLKVFEEKTNGFYKNEYLIKMKEINDLIAKLSNQNVTKDIDLEKGINKLLEKGFDELNKKIDSKISTIFNVAFVPAFHPPPFQAMMNNGIQ